MMNRTLNTSCIDIENVLKYEMKDWTSFGFPRIALSFLYVAIILVSVFGNLCVIFTIVRFKTLHTVRNIFLVNLAFSDIIVSLVSGTITPLTGFRKVWSLGGMLCKFVPLIQGSSTWISTFTLAAIAMDRFILIVYPARIPIQLKQAINLLIFVWLLAFSSSMPVLFKQKLTVFSRSTGSIPFCGKFCIEFWEDIRYRRLYGVIVLVLQFALPFFIICFCYTRIYLKLAKVYLTFVYPQIELLGSIQRCSIRGYMSPLRFRMQSFRHLGTARNSAKSSNAFREHHHRRRRQRTNKMLMAMALLFACCWLPHVTFHVLRDFKYLPNFMIRQVYFYAICFHLIAMTSTCWNPILYALLNDQLRAAFLGRDSSRRMNGKRISTTFEMEEPKRSALNSPRRINSVKTQKTDTELPAPPIGQRRRSRSLSDKLL